MSVHLCVCVRAYVCEFKRVSVSLRVILQRIMQ